MATAAPTAMEMPQQGASPFADPNAIAVYDQLRQNTSPKAFGDEMLAGAAQADPQAVAKFLQKLQSLNVPPEVLDALNNVVDEILANPERYDELRAKYIAKGLPEKILPAKFDPQFFVALNMAIDQMIAEPSGVQSFAQGGIAELKPIAKVIASYGRNGDTMLAHITPAEARMLRRRGGSGTINPDTGLPEFFLDDFFDGIGDVFSGIGDAVSDVLGGIGDAVQDFVESEVGQLVTSVAIGYFLGPVVAAQFGITSSIGVAAISGFVGSAGSTLLGGGDIGDALKAGAIGGLTAGAGAGIIGGPGAFASGPTVTPGQAFQGQVDRFTGMFSSPQAPVLSPPTGTEAIGTSAAAPVPTPSSDPLGDFIQQNDAARAAASNTPARITAEVLPPQVNAPAPVTPVDQVGSAAPKPSPSMFERATDFYNKNISPSGIQEAGREAAMTKTLAQFPGATAEQVINAPVTSVLGKAYQDALPGMFATYAPIAGVGLGALGAFGGFEAKPVQSGPITKQLMKPVTQRIAEQGTQRQVYSQGLPGVVYDQFGAPVYGQSTRLPTYDVPDYNSGGYGMPQGQQAINLPPIYISPPGTIGSRRVEQPYNNSDMYPNLVPRRAADGGIIQKFFDGGSVVSAVREALDGDNSADNTAAVEAEQRAARNAVARQKALRRAQGSGQMYSNINAGLAALAPETNPMDDTDHTYGARNRAAGLAGLQTTYGSMLEDQRTALRQQGKFTGQPLPSQISVNDLYQQYLGRSQTPEEAAADFWGKTFGSSISPEERAAFENAAQPELAARRPMPQPATQPFPMPTYTNAGRTTLMNMGGIATLARGGYPRRTGQISGPGTEKSDSIPAMLSDGEFVMTAKAVRGAGKGSRRAGAKKMYALMHQLEKNSERG